MAEKLNEGALAHPLDQKGCFTAVTLRWLTPLVSKCQGGKLEATEVWPVPFAERPEEALRSLQGAWHRERQRKSPSLARSMMRAFRNRFLCSAALLVVFMCAQLAQPFVVRELVIFLQSPEGHVGWSLAALLLFCSFSSSILVCEYFRQATLLGYLTRTSAMCAVYEQAIHLSSTARSDTSVGQTTNLMSVDAERFLLACQSCNFLWMSPLMVLTTGAIMTYTIGYTALLGLALLVLTIPLQHCLAKYGGRIRVKSMTLKDERMKFVTEVVQGIRVAKLYAWEEAIYSRVAQIRRLECRTLGLSLFLKMLVREGILMSAPVFALALIYLLRRAENGDLPLEQAVLVLGLLNTLRFPMNLLAVAMVSVQDCLVSTQRLGRYLLRSTGSGTTGPPGATGDAAVSLEEVMCCWPGNEDFQLKVPRWTVAAAQRVALLGAVGSGKSSLLAVLLREMSCLQGRAHLQGRVAYMAQTPWIQNASLRDNILFGHDLDEEVYQDILMASALRVDLESLVDGDATDIGERGINLSGGQKARVSLARCLYAAAAKQCDTLILDCPFAALDVITAQTVMEGILQFTTHCTVLCTMSSHTHLLPHFDQVAIMEKGSLVASGTRQDLREKLRELGSSLDQEAEPTVKPKEAPDVKMTKTLDKSGGISTKSSATAKSIMRVDMTRGSHPMTALGKYLGGYSRPVWGYLAGFLVWFIFLAGQITRVLAEVSLGEWAAGVVEITGPLILMAALCILLSLRIVSCSFLTARATRLLHNGMFWRLLRAPVPSYFDVTTIGEICNKFSKDLDFADVQLPEFLSQFLSNSSQLIVILVLTVVALPSFIGILVLMAFFLARVTLRSSRLLRCLKSMEGASRSPIYSSFSETLAGLQTIRAWNLQERFRSGHMKRVLENARFFFAAEMAQIWIMLRLELFTVILIGSFSFMAVTLSRVQVFDWLQVDGPQIGIALVYAIQMTALFQRNAQLVMLVGQMLTACERVLSFEKVEQEPALSLPSDTDLIHWPQGAIRFDQISMQYRDGDLVLKNVSFEISAGRRVGVCGRSGAGKSSLIAVLFRVVDPCHGSVSIDGVDIAQLGLHTLRRNLSLIPQDPVIFSGSLRFNLDPFHQIQDDAQLRDVLEKVGMGSFNLDLCVAELGENLSQGQRQLLCIARVFAAPTQILVLDEATSSMDEKTDDFIKDLLKNTCAQGQKTVLTVAHRLGTIIEYDQILVLSAGEVVEFDTPSALLENRHGYFAKMLKEVMPEKFATKASL